MLTVLHEERPQKHPPSESPYHLECSHLRDPKVAKKIFLD